MTESESLPAGLRLRVVEVGECWTWGGRLDRDGYGVVGSLRAPRAHRVAYLAAGGRIPPGWHLDHTCHDPASCQDGPTCAHRACVRPSHLVPAPPARNLARGRRAPRAQDRGPPRGRAPPGARAPP